MFDTINCSHFRLKECKKFCKCLVFTYRSLPVKAGEAQKEYNRTGQVGNRNWRDGNDVIGLLFFSKYWLYIQFSVLVLNSGLWHVSSTQKMPSILLIYLFEYHFVLINLVHQN